MGSDYYNKVSICGINTNDLKTIPYKQQVILIDKIKNGDMVAREEFIKGNLRLVLSVVQKFSGRGENLDDLFQIGTIGLIKAINNFDTKFNVRFSTYAVPMILGELRRYLRDNNSIRVTRSMRDLAYKALSTKEELTRELGKEPTIMEIAKKLDVKKEAVVIALDAIVDPISLYDPVYNDGGDTIFIMDQVKDSDNNAENWLDEISINEAMVNLSEREKDILNMRFYVGKTQMEVADEIGISQAQVSRLEKSALMQIKNNLN